MSPRTAEQFEQLKGERRQALLRAARVVFARKGLAAAKIGDVAAEVGISYGLVYHYFPQKESLFAAVVEELVEGWEHLLAAARQQPGTPWDRLVFLCTQLVEGVHEQPESLLVMVRAVTEDDAPRPLRESLERYKRQIYEELAGLIEEGQQSGDVAAGSSLALARALMAMVQGLAISAVVDAGSPLPPIEVVLRILKSNGPQAPEPGTRRRRTPRERASPAPRPKARAPRRRSPR